LTALAWPEVQESQSRLKPSQSRGFQAKPGRNSTSPQLTLSHKRCLQRHHAKTGAAVTSSQPPPNFSHHPYPSPKSAHHRAKPLLVLSQNMCKPLPLDAQNPGVSRGFHQEILESYEETVENGYSQYEWSIVDIF
jgi:hypothetical protein